MVEAHRAAFNARNLDALLLGIAEDAKVVSLPAFGTGRGAGDGQVSKVQYREDMAALMARGDRTLLEHAQWTVEFADPTHATAKGQGQLGESRGDFQYKLEKRGGSLDDRRVHGEAEVDRASEPNRLHARCDAVSIRPVRRAGPTAREEKARCRTSSREITAPRGAGPRPGRWRRCWRWGCCCPAPCRHGRTTPQDANQLVEKAKLTVEEFQKDPNMDTFRELAKKAHGMLILPQMIRGAFIIGASGGSGVLVAREAPGGPWKGPAFYTLGGASFGFQAGADVAEVIILAMTERGVTKLLSPQVKLGADVSVTAGPVGGGAAAATAGLSADLVSYSMAKGLYGGFSVDGSVAGVRDLAQQGLLRQGGHADGHPDQGRREEPARRPAARGGDDARQVARIAIRRIGVRDGDVPHPGAPDTLTMPAYSERPGRASVRAPWPWCGPRSAGSYGAQHREWPRRARGASVS